MSEPETRDPLARLFHRWFIQYNPLYLFSAALVLGGVTLMSRGLVQAGSTRGQLGVGAIAELYAWALVAGAALLTHIGLRRPAVLLALLAVLYQGDLTLHTETSAYLGALGWVAGGLWLASFVGKLWALGAALRLRLSRRALVVPSAGALGLVLFPHLAQSLSAHPLSVLVGLWFFALVAAVLYAAPGVDSQVALDGWGQTVLRRGLRAAWLSWGGLALLHVGFWCRELDVAAIALLPVLVLLGARFFASELAVWALGAASFVFVARTAPSFASLTAALLAVALALRASLAPRRVVPAPAGQPGSPYRSPEPLPSEPAWRWVLERPARSARLRLWAGALVALYLAAWTAGWAGRAWPEHRLVLDLAFAALAAAWVWKTRAPLVLVPTAATLLHLGVERGLVSAPASSLEWGLTQVLAGFALLLGTLAATWRWQRRVRDAPAPS